jgi:hypothetical protein
MPFPNDDSGVCSISPSDMAGQIDNILTRLENLEEVIAQLSTSNVNAIQLSDISESVGWVYDVEYMGIPGWTQTAAGTLIPPLGFTVSEILANAQAGQLATSGGGGGVTDHIEMIISTTTTFSPLTFNSINKNMGDVFSWTSGDKVYCSSSGIFSIVINMALSVKTVEGAVSITFRVKRTSDNVTLYTISYQDRVPATTTTYPRTLVNGLLNIKVDDPFYLQFILVNSSTTLTNFGGFVTMTKLGDIA